MIEISTLFESMGKRTACVELQSFKIPPSEASKKRFTEKLLAKVATNIPTHSKQRRTHKRICANIYVGCHRPSRARDTFLGCNCHGSCGIRCNARKLQFECSAKNSEDCGNQRLQRRQYAKTEVREAGEKGYGLFAMEEIMKGTLVIEYVGEVITREECMRRKAKTTTTEHLYFMALDNDRFIDASRKANDARFINHSCDPNCITELWYVGDEPRAAIVALRDISCDEELSFDYAFQCDGKPKYPCLCGSKLCRGFIDAPRRARA